MESIILRQSDPGRLLYGFTVGGHLDISPGEAADFYGEHIHVLVRWLHGLPGTNFDIITYSELDFSRIIYKPSTLNYYSKKGFDLKQMDTTRPYGVRAIPRQRIGSPSSPPPAYSPTAISSLEKGLAATTIQPVTEMKPSVSPLQTSPIRRRPAPALPGAISRVWVIHDFSAEDAGELHVKSGQILDVLEDLGDGWIQARFPSGQVGIVPKTYTMAM